MASQHLDYSTLPTSNRWRISRRRLVVGAVTVALVLLGIQWAPHVALKCDSVLPRLVANAMYFLPQVAFPYSRWWVDALHWLVSALALTQLTNRLKLRVAVPIIIVGTLAIALTQPYLFGLFGSRIDLDGP